ncbi:hypothetical protein HG15A2_45870 [Adhaeretor mobilis]|uniref:Uncharacterized protein n=1 Tax=Adhaeretor mobilis TaxID=1930276 RepID=A0A517N295_9BACT|nr:hypothetical protein HG15A2_45870 [Adhaeretor mobilis]
MPAPESGRLHRLTQFNQPRRFTLTLQVTSPVEKLENSFTDVPETLNRYIAKATVADEKGHKAELP